MRANTFQACGGKKVNEMARRRQMQVKEKMLLSYCCQLYATL